MARNSFIFERIKDQEKIDKPFYAYRGYYRIFEKEIHYPVWLYFGRDEIAVYYNKKDGKVLKIFSLYVAEGGINQNMLSKKVEDYAHMPLWPSLPSEDIARDLEELYVSPELLTTGFFANYCGFAFEREQFIKTGLPTSHPDVTYFSDLGSKLAFDYGKNKLPERSSLRERGEIQDTWDLKSGRITASRINFLKILLDFLFELEYGTIFEGENFFRLQPILQNNLVLDALTRQCRYLSELRKLESFEQDKEKPELPKPFRDAEREFLNVCRLVEYRPVFVSPHSLFQDPEEEVQKVFFKATIGKGKKDRRVYLKNREDAELKNDICTFFMRKYDLKSACLILLPWWGIALFVLTLLSIPIGDLILNQFFVDQAGIFSLFSPLALILFIFAYHFFRGPNLFKLLLPRLFLGIMLGWAVFWSNEELWKLAITLNFETIIIFDLFLLLIIFLYVYTDISNQVNRRDICRIIVKSINLISMALIISLAMGFYVIQFYAEPILQNSEFLAKQRFYKDGEEIEKVIINESKDQKTIDKLSHPADQNKDDIISLKELYNYKNIPEECLYLQNKYLGKFKNYMNIKLFYSTEKYIFYLWSVLLSQFVAAILIGIVLQLIWEDRPITEPL